MGNFPKDDSIILLYDRESKKRHIINLKNIEKSYSTAKGTIDIEDIKTTEFGKVVKTHLGHEYILLPATLNDFIMKKLNRLTQIVYPKDAAYIAFRLDIKPGDTVIESGIGSGAMSAVFARILGERGRLISYEKREEFIKNALKNLKKFNLDSIVNVKQRDIEQGFDEREVDAVFIDVKEPWLYLKQAIEPLKCGKVIGILVPTTNQVSLVLKETENLPLIDIDVSELMQRFWKTNPERLRPLDTMSAHTAFLIFARKVCY